MSTFTKSVCALTVAAAFMAAPASAAIVSADFRAEFDLPEASFGSGARVLENLGASVGAGVELDADDEIANPSSWDGGVDVDLAADGLLTLTGREEGFGGDFDFASVMISNVMFSQGQEIIGFTVVGGTGIFSSAGLSPFPTVRIGSDFLSLSVDTTGSGNVSDFFFAEGGTAIFQLELSPPQVPLPAGGLLLGAAVMGLGLARRKKRTA
ncbi:VPLPA-CTERM sorting domain-containing protein [uncultured Tateyamaria sp.]|uniref:VPLPA-CTERM sorting domain-containing protein n=1 Tax=uncultured Tateyamaria sp. TaxID=455651 RepID=UPI00261A4531|nr:VPLPA-CTERM sorting domain-containing protein [uncultured Tateyamaria sp.]